MRASAGFIFFTLFLAGIALVNLKSMEQRSDEAVSSQAEIVDSVWQPTHLGQMRLPNDSEMILQFNPDNHVTGHAGCNRFFGDYTLVDGVLEIRPLGATRKACPEPENSFEISFLNALESARKLSLSGNRLTMRDEKSLVVARFIAADAADAQK